AATVDGTSPNSPSISWPILSCRSSISRNGSDRRPDTMAPGLEERGTVTVTTGHSPRCCDEGGLTPAACENVGTQQGECGSPAPHARCRIPTGPPPLSPVREVVPGQ